MAAKSTPSIQIGPLKEAELDEADRIVRLAFGTYLGLPNPLDFLGDRDLVRPRWSASNVRMIAARVEDRLIGSNQVTRWGSFGFLGPLTILPEFWNRGVAGLLLETGAKIFDRWGVRHTGLFTFADSAKHIGLYQKFGFWPRYLTAIMTYKPSEKPAAEPVLLSTFGKSERARAIEACRSLTDKIDPGLDLTAEIKALLSQHTGDVVLTYTRGVLDAFAVCLNGAGSEGGQSVCYVKFGAARRGPRARERFNQLLNACDAFAVSRGAAVEAGVNLAREDAFRQMRAHGFRAIFQGVAMQRPHVEGFNRPDVYVVDDWR